MSLRRWDYPGQGLKGDVMKKPAKAGKTVERGKDPDHLEFVGGLPCLITGRKAVEVAHVSMTSKIWGKADKGVGKKSDDRWVVPLSKPLHEEQHEMGEIRFWKKYGIDPLVVANRLWQCSGDQGAALRVIADARSVMKEPKNG